MNKPLLFISRCRKCMSAKTRRADTNWTKYYPMKELDVDNHDIKISPDSLCPECTPQSAGVDEVMKTS